MGRSSRWSFGLFIIGSYLPPSGNTSVAEAFLPLLYRRLLLFERQTWVCPIGPQVCPCVLNPGPVLVSTSARVPPISLAKKPKNHSRSFAIRMCWSSYRFPQFAICRLHRGASRLSCSLSAILPMRGTLFQLSCLAEKTDIRLASVRGIVGAKSP